MRNVSYGELVMLEDKFNSQCKKKGIKWVNEETRIEALNQFEMDYMEGNDNPELMLCGYGYENISITSK